MPEFDDLLGDIATVNRASLVARHADTAYILSDAYAGVRSRLYTTTNRMIVGVAAQSISGAAEKLTLDTVYEIADTINARSASIPQIIATITRPRIYNKTVTIAGIRTPITRPKIGTRTYRIGLSPARVPSLTGIITSGLRKTSEVAMYGGVSGIVGRAVRQALSESDWEEILKNMKLNYQFGKEMREFSALLESELDGLISHAAAAAERDALNAVLAQYGLNSEAQLAGIAAAWNHVDPRWVTAATNYLKNPELLSRIRYYGEQSEEILRNLATIGISKGWNPIKTARYIARYTDNVPFNDALRITRTVQMNAYRTVSHEVYRLNSVENGGVIKGWIWWAELDRLTCASCVSWHGSRHPVTEELEDHHRGRCTPLPETLTYRELGFDIDEAPREILSGEEWFNSQPTDVQRSILGDKLWQYWRRSGLDFNKLTVPYNDPVFGNMYRQASYAQAVGRGVGIPRIFTQPQPAPLSVHQIAGYIAPSRVDYYKFKGALQQYTSGGVRSLSRSQLAVIRDGLEILPAYGNPIYRGIDQGLADDILIRYASGVDEDDVIILSDALSSFSRSPVVASELASQYGADKNRIIAVVTSNSRGVSIEAIADSEYAWMREVIMSGDAAYSPYDFVRVTPEHSAFGVADWLLYLREVDYGQ